MNDLSVRRLAEMAGVSNPYLSQIERGLRRPSADILQQIAKALQISAESLYVRAGMLGDEGLPNRTDLETAIRQAAELTAEQRRSLLSVYRSFVVTAGIRPESFDKMDHVEQPDQPSVVSEPAERESSDAA